MRTAIIIPIYNEANRLDPLFYRELGLNEFDLIIFVDDGCTDNSRIQIDQLTGHISNKLWVSLENNSGKAEAVRAGFKEALNQNISIFVTADADGAVKNSDIKSVLEQHKRILDNSCNELILVTSAARVRLAGWEIHRSTQRQWIGRIIATCVSLITNFEIYDPQSPLKCYSAPKCIMQKCLEEKFKTKWFFEMELLLKLNSNSKFKGNELRIIESPINYFRDVPGSKLKVRHFFIIVAQLGRLLRQTLKQ
jgi:glycosyltransferase involved in cell wall biosynthesis